VDPAERAKLYEASGAAALSVLTDTVLLLAAPCKDALAREACGLPVLRKDFVISINQIKSQAG
jgi:indole-3-glycerol phosphate synthase